MVLIVAAWIGSTARAVDYNRDIRPILSENCFACHGFDEKARKAKLRLDVAEFAHANRDGFTAFKPGDLANSEAWLRIISPDEDEVMPPPDSHSKLTAAQKEKIKLWIEAGAKYSAHWAFVAPQKSPLPRIENSKSRHRPCASNASNSSAFPWIPPTTPRSSAAPTATCAASPRSHRPPRKSKVQSPTFRVERSARSAVPPFTARASPPAPRAARRFRGRPETVSSAAGPP